MAYVGFPKRYLPLLPAGIFRGCAVGPEGASWSNSRRKPSQRPLRIVGYGSTAPFTSPTCVLSKSVTCCAKYGQVSGLGRLCVCLLACYFRQKYEGSDNFQYIWDKFASHRRVHYVVSCGLGGWFMNTICLFWYLLKVNIWHFLRIQNGVQKGLPQKLGFSKTMSKQQQGPWRFWWYLILLQVLSHVKFAKTTSNPVVIPGSLFEWLNANPLEDHPRDILSWQVWNLREHIKHKNATFQQKHTLCGKV